ncbi:MAG: ribonuclease III [Bacilli bacterium]|nr:ribonuclease III [Bacilli bacterium]MBN2697117.1 ribonuclease III [Bacilli bacterium]
MNKKLHELEHMFNLKFNDFDLLVRSMTHASYANENGTRSNERLEFIGDAVLDLAVGKYLFEHLDEPEGVLTKKRAQDVCESSLHAYAMSFSLGDYLLLGKGEEKNGGRQKPALLADAFEAFIGAIFLDKGFDEVYKVLDKVVFPMIRKTLRAEDNDYKSKLQELVQSDKRTLNYVIVSETGPAHDREFVARVYMDDVIIMGEGKGKTKKEAEQNAAKVTLDKLAESSLDSNMEME